MTVFGQATVFAQLTQSGEGDGLDLMFVEDSTFQPMWQASAERTGSANRPWIGSHEAKCIEFFASPEYCCCRMLTEIEVVRDVSGRLDSARIEFMLTGSMAMNYYAQPRMTRDIDVVLALERTQATRIVELFARDYYVSPEAVESAIVHESMFNLIHNESVIKVDCIVRKGSPYRLQEFERRQRICIGDFETCIASKEDLILSKLVWAKDSESELQLRDVKNLVLSGCDRAYIERWTRELGVDRLWGKTLA